MKRFVRMAASLALLVVLVPCQAWAEGAYRRLPWHLVDVKWTLDTAVETETFRDFSMDISIEGDPLASPPLFIAPFSVLRLDQARAYGGLQTWLTIDKNGRKGPGLIFSRFGERRADRLRTAPGGVSESAGYEGDFISVRNAMRWGAGQYVAKLQSEPQPTGPGGERWLSFQVCMKFANSCGSAGELAFPNPNAAMQNSFYSFVEIYDRIKDESEITPLTVILGPPKINGKYARVVKAVAYYPANVPFRVYSMRTADGGVKLIVGPKRSPAELPVLGDARREQVLP